MGCAFSDALVRAGFSHVTLSSDQTKMRESTVRVEGTVSKRGPK